MRRPFLTYLLAVLVPAALTAGAVSVLALEAWRDLAEESQLRVGRMALRALEADLAQGLPPSTAQVGRATGYRTALLRDDAVAVATDPAPPPAGVDGSVLVPGPGGAGGAPAYAVLVAPAEPVGPPLSPPLLLVTGLLFLFASLAGWILLSGHPGERRLLPVALLSALPVVTAWGFLVHVERRFAEAADQAERRDLTRALAVSRLRGAAGDPGEVHRLTGFAAWRVEDGAVAEASMDGSADAVAALRAPPPSFTSTGIVRTPAGDAPYVALRLPDGGFTVAAAVPAPEHSARFSRNAAWAAVALAAWLLLAGAAATARKLGFSSGR